MNKHGEISKEELLKAHKANAPKKESERYTPEYTIAEFLKLTEDIKEPENPNKKRMEEIKLQREELRLLRDKLLIARMKIVHIKQPQPWYLTRNFGITHEQMLAGAIIILIIYNIL